MPSLELDSYPAATTLRDAIARRELGVEELLRATLARIDALNPKVNAIVTLDAQAALATARHMDKHGPQGEQVLFGLPIAVKDLALTRGIRTTFGSPLFADFVPHEDDLFVSRLRAAGAIILGKTNTPEFGAGSQTFNRVFGATRNPYDLSRTCGGSSGGAAVALATGMTALRCAIPPRSAMWSACDRRPAVCRAGRVSCRVKRWRCKGRWHAIQATVPCCCRPWPAPMRGCR